jgi:hypothetical protein
VYRPLSYIQQASKQAKLDWVHFQVCCNSFTSSVCNFGSRPICSLFHTNQHQQSSSVERSGPFGVALSWT